MEKETQSSESTCPTCGKIIPEGAPQGLCPGCLMDRASLTTQKDSFHKLSVQPPTIESMQAVFPDLEIDSLVGQGGMGFVYKARQPKLDRWVALKVLSPELAQNQDFAKRFEREARLLARLNHPNIVVVFDFGREGDFFYLLMEFVEGGNLRLAMRSEKISSEKALKIVPEICEALQFAHDQGVLHRDIKPENILIDTNGRIKIADFGIAKLVDESKASLTKLTGHGAAIGTPHYMAPEQVEQPSEVDHRADIYSLGVVFYELLTGELPLGRFDPPSSKSEASSSVDEIVFLALAKERDKRQQQVSEVKTQVETVSEMASDIDKSFQESPKEELPFFASHRALVTIVILGVLGCLISFGFMKPNRAISQDIQGDTIQLAFGVGGEPWLRLAQDSSWFGRDEIYEFNPSAASFTYGWTGLLIWVIFSMLVNRRWGFSLTLLPVGRDPLVAKKEKEFRFIWAILIQHVFMAFITFTLFALALYLNGNRAPIPLILFFLVNQCMTVLIYSIEWYLALNSKNNTI